MGDDKKEPLFRCIIDCAWEIPTGPLLIGISGIMVHHIFMLDSLYGGYLGLAATMVLVCSFGTTYYINQYLPESFRTFFDSRWFGKLLLLTAVLVMGLAYAGASLLQAAVLDLFVFGLVVPSAFLTIMAMD